MEELTEIAKTIYKEVLEEIEEEITEAFEGIIDEEKIAELVEKIQDSVKENVVLTIKAYYKDEMTEIRKMILGEKLARIVTKEARKHLQELIALIIGKSLELIEELRNEVIGEVFEETEDEDED
ncbi:MAG: hypothetical protein ACTSYD_06520 [Candidatus Heimdallarchaeaceae archaeon]